MYADLGHFSQLSIKVCNQLTSGKQGGCVGTVMNKK